MNATIGKSFGLAMLMAIGVIATLVALGVFTSSNTAASHTGAAVVIPAGGVANVPITPGAVATYTIRFQPASDLVQGESIYIKFDSKITVPTSMEKERITISASGGGTANPLSDPEISEDGNGNTIVKIVLADTDPSQANVQNEIVAWDTASTNTGHILTFSTLANIKNSVDPSLTAAWVNMSDDGITYGAEAEDTVAVYRWLDLDDNSDKRGKVLTLIGKGWKDGTATVFLNLDTTQAFTSGTDIVIGTSDAEISGGEFSATLTVDTNFSVGVNSINATDGRGLTASDPQIGARQGMQSFTLTGQISSSTATASRGEEITVTVEDYGGSTGTGEVTGITFGGTPATLPSTVTWTNNTGTFAVTVPSSAQIGVQTIVLSSDTEAARTVGITVSGLAIVASPTTAVANQDITVSGSGFTKSTLLTSISVAGTANTVTSLTDSTLVTAKSTDSSGNLVATFKIPTDESTRTPGDHKVIITDVAGRVGEAIITIPPRTLVLDPVESRRGSTVNFTGTGYQADVTVSIFYGPTTGTARTTTSADAAGNISGSFTIQNTVGIPSTTTVNSQSACSTTSTGAVETCTQRTASSTHKVPQASVTVEPTSAAPGDTISVSGIGFPGYVSISDMTIATVSALPTPAPATDKEGVFNTTALVPQLDTGSQALLVTAGGTTATSSFTVVKAAVVPVTTTANTTDVFADEITSDNLVRVWLFSNADQTWSFFDPRPAFAAANTLTTSTTGDIVWVNVIADTTFQSKDLFAGWNLISLD